MTPATKALERAGKAYRTIEVDDYQGAARQARLAEQLGVTMDAVFKTLVARLDDADLAIAVVPIGRDLNLKALAALAGRKKAAMAQADEAQAATGYVLGGISPLGHRRRLPVFADESLRDHAQVFVSAGRRGLELALTPDDLVACSQARLGPLAR
ncbi:MAG: Cys-tRNA(Pro) deacylase [Oceanococcus sp.]|nr:MAG: Cys-tRNA(Pro) deacylase [Oceanococcus sp.]